MIRINHLNFQYNSNKIIFQNANVNFNSGVLNGIQGKSGSGKSTLLKILNGELQASMLYTYNDQPVNEIKDYYKHYITYISNDSILFDYMTCYANLSFYLTLTNSKLKEEEILEYIDLPISKKIYPNQLSQGERQRLILGCVLALNTPVLLVDEMTSSLDYDHMITILELMKKLAKDFHKCIIIVSHDERVMEHCDNTYLIDEHKITEQRYSKEEECQTEIHPFFENKIIEISVKEKLKKNKWILGFNVLLFSLFSSVSILGLQIGDQYTHIADYILKRSDSNIMYMTNLGFETIENAEIFYAPDYLPIEIDQNEILALDSSIQSVQSLYYLTFETKDESYDDITFQVENENTSYDVNIPWNRVETYIWSSDLNDLQKYAIEYVEGEEGIYLTYYQLSLLNIDHIDDQTYITFSVQVPVKYTIGGGATYTSNYYYNYDTQNLQYETVDVRVKVLGVLNKSYTNLTATFGYMDYDSIKDIVEEQLSNTVLKEDEYLWKTNTYVIQTNSKDPGIIYDKIIETYRNCTVYNASIHLNQAISIFSDSVVIVKKISYIALIFSAVLALIIGFVRKMRENKTLSRMNELNLHRITITKIYFIEGLCLSLCSIPVTYIIFKLAQLYGENKNIIAVGPEYSKYSTQSICYAIILSIALLFVSYLFTLLYRKKKYLK